jgi:hypothetical protein
VDRCVALGLARQRAGGRRGRTINPEAGAAFSLTKGITASGGAVLSGPGRPARYEIRVEGVLDSQWADWLGGLQVTRHNTQTVISGPLPDQPALHGVLAKIRDLGLCLISVRRLGAGEARNEAQQ